MRFLVGAIKNAELAQRFFPGFTVRYYVSKKVPYWVKSTLMLFPDVEVIEVPEPENNLSRMWRFMAILDEDVDVVLSRDVDARLSRREAEAHQEFMDSEYGFHIIRDHPTGHGYLISAGMFAIKTEKYRKIFKDTWDASNFFDEYMADQKFMSFAIYPRIERDCLIHDEYYNYLPSAPSRKTTIKRKRTTTLSHIGAAVDENDVFVYQKDRDASIEENGHVSYIYELENDEDTNNR